ncbi:restriction endonuclease subunit S [Marinifilum fragile]|uniref:restriction endonuclease subunit S n=1 Tax=Marinifilum fragile TaxID=570161 RepID=UPI002AA79359|nr:restriction endonuclease subunit S [Marinifilum fragile]
MNTEYKKYSEFKDTNSKWVPFIPKDWDIASLRWLSKRFAGGTPDKNKPEYWDDKVIPWLNSGAVNQEIIKLPSNYISNEGFANSSAKWIPIGSLVLALAGQGKTKGTVAYCEIKTTCNQSLAAITFEEGFYSKYFYWYLKSQYKNIRGLASSDGRDGLNLEMLGSIKLPIPSNIEQYQIANFLDQKTGQIDRLIAQKERLLKLLSEKRTAIITQAVTKGLDPNVEMKDSGIDWLGEIPRHWGVKRFKFCLTEPLKYGANESAESSDRDQPRFVRITDVDENGNLKEETFRSIDSEIAKPFLLKEGDLLMARSGATVGKNFMYKENWGIACFAGYLIRARIDQEIILPEFGNLFLNSGSYWDWVNSIFIQSTIQNISAEKYANLVLPIPPQNEQVKIVAFASKKREQLGNIIDGLSESLSKLKEYREAIITAAVTGQIDVRKEVLNEQAY